MKIIILCFVLLTSSCSVTYINAPKCVHVHGNDNKAEITGSDLKGNTASQSADGKLTIPLAP